MREESTPKGLVWNGNLQNTEYILWRRRQQKLKQGGGCVSSKERVYRSCAEKSWVQHLVI